MSEGMQIGDYQLLESWPPGRTGQLYRARDAQRDREVAIKLAHQHLWRGNLAGQTRLQQQIQQLRALYHPGIVPIDEFQQKDQQLYWVMPFVAGGNLRQYRERMDGLSVDTLMELGLRMAGALQYAHARGMVHGHLKPENVVLLSDESLEPLLTDFGLPLLPPRGAELPTPPVDDFFLAPEQRTEGIGPIDARTDVYRLGLLLRWLWQPARVEATAPPAEPVAAATDDWSRLQPVVERMTAAEPDGRFPTVTDLLRALQEVKANRPTRAPSRPAPTVTPAAPAPSAAAAPVEPPTKMGLLLTRAPQDPQIIKVFQEYDQLARMQPGDNIVIGRSQGEILIDDDRIADPHLLLGRSASGWLVTPLSDAHLVRLDNRDLLAGVPQTWSPEQVLSLGRDGDIAAELYLHDEGDGAATAVAQPLTLTLSDLTVTEVDETYQPTLMISSQHTRPLYVQLRLKNAQAKEGDAPSYRFDVADADNRPGVVLALQPDTVSLQPGESKQLTLTVQVGPQPLVDQITFEIEAESLGARLDAARVSGRILLALPQTISMAIAPEQVVERGVTRITLTNPTPRAQMLVLLAAGQAHGVKIARLKPAEAAPTTATPAHPPTPAVERGQLAPVMRHSTMSRAIRMGTDSGPLRDMRVQQQRLRSWQQRLNRFGLGNHGTQLPSRPTVLQSFQLISAYTTEYKQEIRLPPYSQADDIELVFKSASRPWVLLRPQQRPFQILALDASSNDPGNEAAPTVLAAVEGSLHVSPRLPTRLFYAVTLLVLLVCVGFLLAIWRSDALAQAGDRQQAATARALAAFDDDGDGLSNFDELNKYGTDPQRPDSDGDGVSDFDEVFRPGGDPNDPLRPTATATPAPTFTPTPGPPPTATFVPTPAAAGSPEPPPLTAAPLHLPPAQAALLRDGSALPAGQLLVGDDAADRQEQLRLTFDVPATEPLRHGLLLLHLAEGTAVPSLGPLWLEVAALPADALPADVAGEMETAVLHTAIVPITGSSLTVALPSELLDALKAGGSFTFRLWFELPTNRNQDADSLRIVGVDAADETKRPQLILDAAPAGEATP